MNAARHTESFPIRAFECDPHGRLLPRTLCLLLQETAAAHASELGVAVETLLDRGVAWVLSQLRIAVDRWPAAGETLLIETWPEAASGTRIERRFRLLDGDGKVLGEAITLWLVMDLQRRRPVRLPEYVTATFGTLVGPNRPSRLDPIPALERPELEQTLTSPMATWTWSTTPTTPPSWSGWCRAWPDRCGTPTTRRPSRSTTSPSAGSATPSCRCAGPPTTTIRRPQFTRWCAPPTRSRWRARARYGGRDPAPTAEKRPSPPWTGGPRIYSLFPLERLETGGAVARLSPAPAQTASAHHLMYDVSKQARQSPRSARRPARRGGETS